MLTAQTKTALSLTMFCAIPSLSLILSLLAHPVVGLPQVLIYSATAGYRHDSIPTAANALISSTEISFNHTEDAAWFTDEILSTFDALLFLSTTGEGELPLLSFLVIMS